MANVKNNAAAQETRRRLLEAAGEVFAERGFHAATIKEITDRAGASLASVNYHFRDKSELYAAVLRRIEAEKVAVVPPASTSDGGAGGPGRDAAQAELRRAIRHIVTTMLSRDRPVWERVLLARELAQPTAALDPLIESVARPLHERLADLVAAITGRDRGSESVALNVSSIVAQCVYHMEHQALIGRLHPQMAARADAQRLADHIADFSLAALHPRTRASSPRRAGRGRRSHTSPR